MAIASTGVTVNPKQSPKYRFASMLPPLQQATQEKIENPDGQRATSCLGSTLTTSHPDPNSLQALGQNLYCISSRESTVHQCNKGEKVRALHLP